MCGPVGHLASKLLQGNSGGGMTFNTLVERVEKDFAEMPGLEVTMAQGVRLWNIGADDCRFVIDALVDMGFLKWTTKRTVIRTGRTFSLGKAGAN